MYFSVSWLKYGTVPSTVMFDTSFSMTGEALVHKMTESAKGSPCLDQ